ncbi:MAG: zinc-ribbon and DUF3426 domain-containing protein [Gammaproteobacteria bacterium]|nr:zinc-ribbon and DUF3426 domain-containing protein [Gammaproteobacteria bacterium]
MITECPHCHKRFLVMEDLFESVQGTMRCAACNGTFKVFDHLCEYGDSQAGLLARNGTSTPADPAATEATVQASNNPLALAQRQRSAAAAPTAESVRARAALSALARQRGDGRIEPVLPAQDSAINMQTLSAQLRPDPLEMKAEPAAGSRLGAALRAAPAALCAVVLGAALTIQWFDLRADQLPQNALVQQAYRHLCGLLRCGSGINPRDYVSRKLIVYSHPEQANALIVETVILNTGPGALPYPALQLEFTDLQGAVVARQLFQPADYLRGELAGATALAPASPVQLQLEIVDPGNDAVNYTLKMLPGEQDL